MNFIGNRALNVRSPPPSGRPKAGPFAETDPIPENLIRKTHGKIGSLGQKKVEKLQDFVPQIVSMPPFGSQFLLCRLRRGMPSRPRVETMELWNIGTMLDLWSNWVRKKKVYDNKAQNQGLCSFEFTTGLPGPMLDPHGAKAICSHPVWPLQQEMHNKHKIFRKLSHHCKKPDR